MAGAAAGAEVEDELVLEELESEELELDELESEEPESDEPEVDFSAELEAPPRESLR